MNDPVYRAHLTEEYWQFAASQTPSGEDTARLAYLQTVLDAHAPGQRIVVLGYAVAPVALGLARAGFTVTGLDGLAGPGGTLPPRHGTAVAIQRGVALLTAEAGWPAEADAIICLGALGWGTEAAERRLLRRLRRRLAPAGVLIVADLDALGGLRPFAPVSSAQVGTTTYRLHQHYDCVSGHSRGSLVVARPDAPERAIPYERRLYTLPELTSLVRTAGFILDRVDADFTVRQPPTATARLVQLLALPLPPLPASLAVASWRTPDAPRLELRYAPDETPWLDPAPAAIWEALLRDEPGLGAEAVESYPVDDPYGGERGAAAVSAHFGFPIAPRQVTFGPGVTSLLHDLCDLAEGGLIVTPQLTHPDLTAWAAARGSQVHFVAEPATLDQLLDAVQTHRPALVHLDRPSFAGDLPALDDLYTLGAAAAEVGAAVLIDESPATYFGPGGSAAPLIQRLDNLVVLRGLTKAYSWGGLRAAYALAGAGVGERVRELVPPMQVGELAFRAVLRILAAGDIFGPLRVEIRRAKPICAALLRARGLPVREGHPDLPWVIVPDPGGVATRQLDALGLRGLRFVPSPLLDGPGPELLLLFTPLSAERMAALRECLEITQESAMALPIV